MKLVLKEVSDLERFSKAMNIPNEVCTKLCDDDEEEVVGKMSSFLLEKGLMWSSLKRGLIENNEMIALERVCLFENVVFEGITSRQNSLKKLAHYYVIEGDHVEGMKETISLDCFTKAKLTFAWQGMCDYM